MLKLSRNCLGYLLSRGSQPESLLDAPDQPAPIGTAPEPTFVDSGRIRPLGISPKAEGLREAREAFIYQPFKRALLASLKDSLNGIDEQFVKRGCRFSYARHPTTSREFRATAVNASSLIRGSLSHRRARISPYREVIATPSYSQARGLTRRLRCDADPPGPGTLRRLWRGNRHRGR